MFLAKLFNSWAKKIIVSLTLIIIIIWGSYFIYNYKKDSADGRILIWKVTLQMIADNPIFGNGLNTFQSKYMHYQENYFKINKKSTFKYLADNNNYAFNEPLRLLSEQGLVGLSLIL